MGAERRRPAGDKGVDTEEENAGRGELVLVATPIGNVGDLSPRASEVLASAEVVLCEDTRHSGRLFQRVGVSARRLVSLHGHNEAARTTEVLALLRAGHRVAVVSDAGTPTISDPGRRLVAAAHEMGATVTSVPGPSAVTAAVAVSGFTDGRFRFEGFLERKGPKRREQLAAIVRAEVPTVLYEAPGRVEALLSELAELSGDERLVVVGRELTKLHEEVWRGTVEEAAHRWPRASAKGEFVIVVEAGRPASKPADAETLRGDAEKLIASGNSRRDAVRETASRHGVSTRAVYGVLAGEEGSAKEADL